MKFKTKNYFVNGMIDNRTAQKQCVQLFYNTHRFRTFELISQKVFFRKRRRKKRESGQRSIE